jgi:hypothetical protein
LGWGRIEREREKERERETIVEDKIGMKVFV